MNRFINNKISLYRNELFGIAALGVLLVHSTCDWGVLKKFVNMGGQGVYIFIILSGIGLYFSMTKLLEKNKFSVALNTFYKNRCTRILPSFFLVAGVWYLIKCLILEKDLLGFVLGVSTVGFWMKRGGYWYFSLLIPLYLIYPFYYIWIEKGHRLVKTIFAVVIIEAIGCATFFINDDSYKVFHQVYPSLSFFFVGHYIAPKIKDKSFNVIKMSSVLLAVIAIKVVICRFVCDFAPLTSLGYGAQGVLSAFIFSEVLDLIKSLKVNAMLSRLGKISLEIYLSNVTVLSLCNYFNIDIKMEEMRFNYRGFVFYLMVVIVGLMLSFAVGRASKRINESRQLKNSIKNE